MADVAVPRGARRPRRTFGAFSGLSQWDAEAMRRLTYGLLLVFWFTLPWEALIRLGGTSTLARGIGGLVALSALVALMMGGRRTRVGEVLPMMLLLSGVVLASTMWSTDVASTTQRIVTITQLLVMVGVTWEFAQTRARVRGLMTAWVAGCVFLGLVIALPFLLGSTATRFSAPGTSPGDNAYSLLLAVPLAWYLSLRPGIPGWQVWAYRLFVPVACGSVVLTASRAGLVTMVVAVLVVPLTLAWVTARGRLGVGLTVAALAVVAAPLAALAAAPLARLGTTESEIATGTLNQRTTVWKIGLDLMAEHPILGLGAGGSKDAIGAQIGDDKGLHNTFLSIGVELGLVGLLVFLLLLVAGCYRSLFALPPLESRVMWVTIAVFLLSLTTRHADYQKSTYALITLFALIGLLWSRGRASDPATAPETDPGSRAALEDSPGFSARPDLSGAA